MKKLLILLLAATSLTIYWPQTVRADEVEVVPGIVVVGWERLSAEAQSNLAKILNSYPRSLTPWLRVITVDNALIPSPLSEEVCAPNGEFLSQRPCGFNMLSSGDTLENQFPEDAPESLWLQTYLAVIVHEYGHQIGHGTSIEQGWVDSLIAEAGSNPQNYLRSMIPAGYFQQNPQEFIASMWGQWGTCSRCTLRLALARWDRGNPNPLNQVVLLLALSGFRHGFLNDNNGGTIIAHVTKNGFPIQEFWEVHPWSCGKQVSISGPSWKVTLSLSDSCRVLGVAEQEGL